MGESTNLNEHLLPDRHKQHDLFICDVADAVLKDVMQQMEHPFYSLSKKPETQIRRYEHNGHWLQVTPSVKGLATIYDKDILIYCISQIMHKLNQGQQVSKRVRINSHELLMFTNRGTSGRDYMALAEALERIRGTTISTNIITGDEEQIDTFGLIDSSSIRRKHGLDGRLLWCEITLSDWVFNAIQAKEVLTLHRDYFRLRRPIERRIYEIARKHCGLQEEWPITLELLHKKTGSKSSLKEFRRAVRHLAKHDHLPDYRVIFDDDADKIIFVNRDTMKPEKLTPLPLFVGHLDPEVFSEVRKVALGWDPYALEGNWREWLAQKSISPKNPEKHFVSFCKSWFKTRGRP